ncbi:MAG: PQQ-binding-like beta-propeller repeat protein [Planctomycetes bacterium]|nr:PQQ-binding-like beta-propeller repeat protein [Planctomycetota bacterium]
MHAFSVLALLTLPLCALGTDWPQGAGPNGDWSVEGAAPPLRFSARTGENLLWRTPLPETGQGGITIVGEHVFVATLAPFDPEHPLTEAERALYTHATEGRSVVGKDIDAHALDARTGKLLWTRRIAGVVPSIYSYPFSDATSASPVADAKHVWFTNGGGKVVCYTHAGELVWEREFTPTFDGPFNKQFEPFLVQDGERAVFVGMEPFPEQSGRWNRVVGLDAATGALLWKSEDALTHYNAPQLVATPSGPALLIARGGPHDVPELPLGVSLTALTGAKAGKSLWRYEDPRPNHEGALQTMAHDEHYAYWVLRDPASALVVLDLASGKELASIPLHRHVDVTSRDPATGAWQRKSGVDLKLPVFPARYTLIAAAGRVFFQCYAAAFGKETVGPAWSFGRVDPATKAVEYLEVPTDVVRGTPDVLRWRTPLAARAVNSRGLETTGDERSRWSGWDWVFNGSPTRVNERLYFTLASGLVYVLDAQRKDFDGGALLALDDLGTGGETWCANSLSYSAGRLYQRTAAELLCFGAAASAR